MADDRPETPVGDDTISQKIRLSWLVIDLIRRNGLSNSIFAKIMGCTKNTINNYRHMYTTPDLMFHLRLAGVFGVNLIWLHTGAGHPFEERGAPPLAKTDVAPSCRVSEATRRLILTAKDADEIAEKMATLQKKVGDLKNQVEDLDTRVRGGRVLK
ncbi:MAG: helix-turn-helix transcriptional regulator [Desulfobacterales bacterium]|nr:helix-turn-helix transcriptional regulator [Desulfobacterales bacterium]